MLNRSLAIITLLWATASHSSPMCNYNTYTWNTIEKKATNYRRVSKPYGQLAAYERHDRTRCTVCEEDQKTIRIGELPAFKICKYQAAEIERILRTLISMGEPIHTVVGYRVGMTKGDPDANGNRTRFSNHSFGISLDINRAQNGLYTQCFTWGPTCQLIQGGKYQPEKNIVGTLTADSNIVQALQSIGLQWGGKIAGRQKDFMHFSPSGY